MMPFTTSIAVAAGVCLAFGVLYLFVGTRRPTRRRRSLLFALFALGYAGASLAARASFLSHSPQSFVAANRVSLVFAAVGFTALGWYIAEYTRFSPSWLLWTLTGAWTVLAVVLIAAPDLFYGADAGTEVLILPWDEAIRITGAEPGPGFVVAVVAQLLLVGYIVTATVRQFRRGNRTEAIIVGIGIGFFTIALVGENLSSLEVWGLPPTADFGFLGFLLALSFAMVNESIDTEQQLVRYQGNLEQMVADRTAELEDAQAALVGQAEESAAAAERIRISRDLHDAVSQLLFSINLLAGSLPRQWDADPQAARRSATELQRLARGALAEMRTLLRELRPHTIPQADLELLVVQLTDGVSARIDVPIAVDVDLDGRLPTDVHLAVYRICQEAVANVAKHADASRVAVVAAGGPDRVSLSVRDDGRGIDLNAGAAGTIGLATMNERAKEVGGSLTVAPGPDGGTVVAFEWERRAD